ncbi:MAG TPA: hypothetical protein VFN21_03050 [Acidimicrobiales bacterium]|nr:hypothetical protein [Acidimicrobiales bacterium]
MKILPRLAGLAALALTGLYTVISLVRWQWSRAMFYGLAFLAVEIALALGSILTRLTRIERHLDTRGSSHDSPTARRGTTLGIIRQSRYAHDRFPWLPTQPVEAVTGNHVFITLLVGGGALLAGGTWVIDKVASHVSDPGREAALADELAAIAYPDGLLVDEMAARARTNPDVDDPRLDLFFPEVP